MGICLSWLGPTEWASEWVAESSGTVASVSIVGWREYWLGVIFNTGYLVTDDEEERGKHWLQGGLGWFEGMGGLTWQYLRGHGNIECVNVQDETSVVAFGIVWSDDSKEKLNFWPIIVCAGYGEDWCLLPWAGLGVL